MSWRRSVSQCINQSVAARLVIATPSTRHPTHWLICAQVVGTRCASTKFALSVYFCGAATANGDELNTWNGWAGGLEALRETLESMRMISRKGGVHPAFVYELSLGQKERSDPALEHVWTIVAQPDGTYMWLQSYIQHYTLQKWMKEALRRGEQYLTYEQLTAKLDKIQDLRAAAATDWTARANTLYEELFWVDVIKKKGSISFSAANAIEDLWWQTVWKSTGASGAPDNSSPSHFSAMTRPSWLGRAARNRHRHAIEQASRRWRGGRRYDSARTRRKILISTQVPISYRGRCLFS